MSHRLQLELLGRRLTVVAPSIAIIDAVNSAADLAPLIGSDGTDTLTYEFQLLAPGVEAELPRGRPIAVSSWGDFDIFTSPGGSSIVVEGRSMATLSLADGKVKVMVHAEHAENAWVTGHRLFFLPLLEWMRFRGHFPIHGACFEVDGATVIVSGPGGAGKSTSALSAIAGNCPFLSDDTLFARRDGGQVVVDPYPEAVKIGRGSARFFPDWADRLEPYGGKLRIPEADLPGGGRIRGVAPSMLLFPTITGESVTRFEPVSGEAAMISLLPQSIIPSSSEIIQKHMDLLGDLVDQARSFRLLFGSDPRELPEHIRTLL